MVPGVLATQGLSYNPVSQWIQELSPVMSCDQHDVWLSPRISICSPQPLQVLFVDCGDLLSILAELCWEDQSSLIGTVLTETCSQVASWRPFCRPPAAPSAHHFHTKEQMVVLMLGWHSSVFFMLLSKCSCDPMYPHIHTLIEACFLAVNLNVKFALYHAPSCHKKRTDCPLFVLRHFYLSCRRTVEISHSDVTCWSC